MTRRMADIEARRRFLEEVRVLVLTDPIPNDVCVVRRGFPQRTWERLERSIQRFVATAEGKLALHDLVAGVAVNPASDATFDGFRRALATAGMSAEQLMQAEEQKLEKKRAAGGGGS